MTLGLAASRPLGEIVLHIWETVGKLDPLLADLALEDLLSRAVVGTSDDVAVIGEVRRLVESRSCRGEADDLTLPPFPGPVCRLHCRRSRLGARLLPSGWSSPAVDRRPRSKTLTIYRSPQVQTVSEPSNRGPTEATLSAAHSRLLRLLVKLSYRCAGALLLLGPALLDRPLTGRVAPARSRRHPSHLAISLPELLVACLCVRPSVFSLPSPTTHLTLAPHHAQAALRSPRARGGRRCTRDRRQRLPLALRADWLPTRPVDPLAPRHGRTVVGPPIR